MGTPELTRLWNLTASNMEGCVGGSDAVPGMDTFFENARMELDPAEDVGEEFWSTRKPEFGWRALRVLAHHQLKDMKVLDKEMSIPSLLENLLAPKVAVPAAVVPSADEEMKEK